MEAKERMAQLLLQVSEADEDALDGEWMDLEPVLSTLWVWLFWHENFSAYGWAGSALVISAVFLLTADRS